MNFNGVLDGFLVGEREGRERKVGVYYASEVCHPCMRDIYYRYKLNKPLQPETLRRFKLGTLIHNFLQEVFKEKTIEEGIERSLRRTYSFGKYKFEIHGRCDLILQCDGYQLPIELKSCAPNMFRYKLPKRRDEKQLMFYLSQLKLGRGIILYVEKYGMKFLPCEVVYDPQIYKEIITDTYKLHRSLKKGVPPPKPKKPLGAPKNWDWFCGYCLYQEECKENG